MPTLQEYFNSNEPKNRNKVILDGEKLGNIEGETLIIDDFKDLDYIVISNLPHLKHLTIKNCGKLKDLEIYLEKNIEVVLVGDVKSLSSFKTNNINKPTIIYQEKVKEGFCYRCFFDGAVLIGLVILASIVVYFSRKINEMREFIKVLQNKIRKLK